MKETPKFNLIDAIGTDLHESIDDLLDILKKQQKSINEINTTLANKKSQKKHSPKKNKNSLTFVCNKYN